MASPSFELAQLRHAYRHLACGRLEAGMAVLGNSISRLERGNDKKDRLDTSS